MGWTIGVLGFDSREALYLHYPIRPHGVVLS